MAGSVPFKWPVLLPAVTEIGQAFSTPLLSSPKSLVPFTKDATDFLNVLNSLDLVPHGTEETEPPASLPSSTPTRPELQKPSLTTVQAGEPSADPPRPRSAKPLPTFDQPDRILSVGTTNISPIPITIAHAAIGESLPATLQLGLPSNFASQSTEQPNEISPKPTPLSQISTADYNQSPRTTPNKNSAIEPRKSAADLLGATDSDLIMSNAAAWVNGKKAEVSDLLPESTRSQTTHDPGESDPRSNLRLKPQEPQSEGSVALSPVASLPIGTLFPPTINAPLPPAPTPQPDSRSTAREDRASSLPGNQLVAKLSQPSLGQPAFTAFEARLTPRSGPSKPLGDVSPSQTTTATAIVPATEPHSDTRFQNPEPQAQPLKTEIDSPQPKSGATVQPTAFETKPDRTLEAVPIAARPLTARRQELQERQVTTTQTQMPQGQTVGRPQVFQQSKPDAHVVRASSPDLAEPPAPQTGPARDISFRVGDSGADYVNVKVTDRAGQLHVAVQSADSAVAQTLQSGVKELANRLETSGFHTETLVPGRTQATPDSQQNSAFQDFQQNRRAPEQEQRAQKKRRSGEDATFTLTPNQENQ